MSVVDDLLQPSSDSFWEIGKYMRTVKRCDNGNKLCDQLRRLIEERNRIEKSYASSLSTWAKSWHEFLDKGLLVCLVLHMVLVLLDIYYVSYQWNLLLG